MLRTIVPSESSQRWKQLLILDENHVSNSWYISREQQASGDDPFDCEDLKVLPLPDAIERILQSKILEWENLDSRLIAHACPDISIDECQNAAPLKGRGSNNRKPKPIRKRVHVETLDKNDDDYDISIRDLIDRMEEEEEENNEDGGDYCGLQWGWHANRIRLPDGFDYMCKRTDPPTAPSQPHKKRRQVLNIDDPLGLPLDYETELWKLFKSVPVEEDIEKSTMDGCLCKNSLEVKEEIEQGFKDYTRMDAHALGRLRKKERHNWPSGGGTQLQQQRNHHSHFEGVTVRVECWRRLLKRGSSSDPDRLEMEFCGEQTLLDVHKAIVTCANDQLFTKGMMKDAISSERSIDSSGIFMIENTFYTAGSVDYYTPIKEWLDHTASKSRTRQKGILYRRYKCLGLSSDTISSKLMKETRLDTLSFRLGVRYYHSFHGDCETSIFFTDVRTRLNNEPLQFRHYPLFHDIWCPDGPLVFCRGCEKSPATIVTIEDEMTDGGPTHLCPSCHYKIHYTKDGSKLTYNNFRVFPHKLTTFRNDFQHSKSSVDELF